jgi:hypothetical protein
MPPGGSAGAPRWLLAVAVAAGIAGLVLKLSDFGGTRAPSPPAAGDAVEGPDGVGRVPAEHASHQPGTAHRPSSGGDVASPGEARDPLDRAAAPPRVPGSRPSALLDRPDAQTRRAARQARRAARQQAAAARRNPSLHVGAAGGDGAPASGGGTERALGGRAAAVPAEQPATPPEAAKAAPPEAPAVSDVAFASGDADQYATDDPVQVEDLGNISPRSGSLSFWLQPQWGEGSADDASFLELGDGQLRVVKNVNYLRFEWMSQAGGTGGIGVPITEWKPGDWHAVTTTWNGNTYALYVDGQLVSTKTDPGAIPLPDDPRLWIGSNYPESRPIAPGLIARVDVRNRPLGPGEVARGFDATTGR